MGIKVLGQWLLAFQFAFSPLAARAQSAPAARAATAFDERNVTVTEDARGARVSGKNAEGRDVVLEMPAGDEQTLRKFSPSALLEKMKHSRPGETFRETYQRFPRESFLFFLAIGGVSAFQLATDYSSNPTRLSQHVHHSISPLGMFSFFTFMYANGVTDKYLRGWIKNPRFHSLIPYAGLSAGFFVQTMVSTFAADPEVKSCVAQIVRGQKPEKGREPCDAAYARYVLGKQLSLAAPSLVSMIGSMVLAGLVQKGLEIGVFKLTGVDIAMWFIPGGVGIQLMRFAVVSTLQMALFYYIDAAWLNRKISFAWRNVVDGLSLGRLEREIVAGVAWKKANGWNAGKACRTAGRAQVCDRELALVLKRFQNEASDWRQLNLLDVHEGHAAWQEKLAQVSAQYNAAKAFYRDFVNEVRNSRYELVPPALRRLEWTAPLMGVTPKGVATDKVPLLYHRPAFYQEHALLTAVETGRWLEGELAKPAFTAALTRRDVDFLKSVAGRLKSEDANAQGKAILELNEAIAQDRRAGPIVDRTLLYEDIRSKLGKNPTPYFEKGRGFLTSFELFSESESLLKGVSFPSRVGVFQTPRATDAMLMGMFCGPDVDRGDKTVSSIAGFPAKFAAPRVVDPTPATQFHCNMVFNPRTVNNMYRNPIKTANGEEHGVLEYVKNQIRLHVLGGREKANFDDWWEAKVEGEMKSVYDDYYGPSYDRLVGEMVRQLWRTSDSKWSAAPLASGTIASIRQQMNLNLVIVGEMLKDLYQAQHGRPLPNSYFSSAKEAEILPARNDGNDSSESMLATLRRGSYVRDERTGLHIPAGAVFEWNRLIRAYPNAERKTAGPVFGHALHLQKEIEYEFEVLVALLRKIKVAEVPFGSSTRTRITGDVENYEFREQVEKVSKKLEELGNLLGAGDKKDAALVQLPPEAREIAITALEGALGLASEVAMYGQMANAVNWDKLQEKKKAKEEAARLNRRINDDADELSKVLEAREREIAAREAGGPPSFADED